MPLFRIFKKEFYGDKADLLEDEITILVTVTKEVFEKVKLEIGAIGFGEIFLHKTVWKVKLWISFYPKNKDW